ncbi:alpha/beta fold hydrolase [Actinosynnema sp. CS-041913]|uniref:alpha/beta fold hydrolase n=1 Tax=Actinosynnema sp. CS-041913 TaxID=3239917 RepID=UPI003D8DB95D
MTIRGTAAGVPYVASPPRAGRRLVLVWHLMGEPGSPEAMAEALPLDGVDAWRVYLALPPWREGGDGLVDAYAPMVSGAVERVPSVVAELRGSLSCDDGPVDVVGGSAGGHVALLTAVSGAVAVRRVAVVNPAVTAQAVVEASLGVHLDSYEWTPEALAAAGPLDVVARARALTVPLLVVRGEHEYPAFRAAQAVLHAAVPGSRLVDVPGLPHMLVSSLDVVEAEVTAWLND